MRYEGSSIDTMLTEKGIKFEHIPDVHMIYIAKFDVFHRGCNIYHLGRVVKESGDYVENGFNEIYMNVQAADDTKLGKLARYMLNTQGDCPEFPRLSARVKYIKERNGGDVKMSEIVRKFAEEYAKEYAEERVKEREKELIEETARSFFANGASLELVIASIKELPAKRIQEIYASL